MVVDRMLDVSVWADLRFGLGQLSLLASVGARAGLTSILIAKDGPLTPSPTVLDRIDGQFISSIPILHRRWPPTRPRAGCQHLPTWPGRVLFAAVAEREYQSVDVAVSIGRTDTEAKARAISDPLLQELSGGVDNALIGRLEDAQEKVARLAASGIRAMHCILPSADLVDHLAQISSIAVGTLETHYPGSPRSADPLPPLGWGGPGRVAPV